MFFFQNLTAELFLLESPDDSYFPKSGGSTFLKTVGSHFSEICGNKITAYRALQLRRSEPVEWQRDDGPMFMKEALEVGQKAQDCVIFQVRSVAVLPLPGNGVATSRRQGWSSHRTSS